MQNASRPGGADFEPRNVRWRNEFASPVEAEPVVVDDGVEQDAWLVLPKLLSVPDSDGADDASLASELDGKMARMTSLVRLCHRTCVGKKTNKHGQHMDVPEERQNIGDGKVKARPNAGPTNYTGWPTSRLVFAEYSVGRFGDSEFLTQQVRRKPRQASAGNKRSGKTCGKGVS